MAERTESARHALMGVLALGPASLRDLSQAVSLSEAEVADHLPHIEKSAKSQGYHFVVDPARCPRCDYAFEHRTRVKTPSRCPSCKSERVRAAHFSLVER